VIARGKVFEEDLIIADINAERVFNERLHDPRRRQEKLDVVSDGMRVDRIVLRESANGEREGKRQAQLLSAESCQPFRRADDSRGGLSRVGCRDARLRAQEWF